MTEAMIQEILAYAAQFLPSITSIGTVILVCLKIYKIVNQKLSEFMQSKELKDLIACNRQKDTQIQELIDAINALTVQNSSVKPKGYTDDGSGKK